jgi:hypothetical protein
VVRGGSYKAGLESVRSGRRIDRGNPGVASSATGFRPVRTYR